MHEIKFTATKDEFKFIGDIAHRAVSMANKYGCDYDIVDALMDIEACHSNGCPLKLSELAQAPSADFAHDVFGIRRHINRETGKLEDCFLPRFAMPSI